MTRKELSRIYYLNRELQMWERELNEMIQDSQIKGQYMDGMPFQKTNVTSDKVSETAIKIVNKAEVIKLTKAEIEKQIEEVYRYIATLDDSILRQIVKYRCIDLMSWTKVARMIGGGNTADGLRMMYTRAIPEK